MLCRSFLLCICFAAAVTAQKNPIVTTPIGTFEGFVADGLTQFIGIRYGTPPVGDLRFSPSSIYIPSTNQTIPANQYGPQCYQPPLSATPPPMSEDCLFLNIYVSATPSVPGLLPVMFWIHGGGFLLGSGTNMDFQVLANLKNVVVVSINYRLGPLGLLSTPELLETTGRSGGINAVGDQLTALEWVYSYIGYFNGDPNRISVYGESAGGVSSAMILITPALEIPIQYSAIQSGPLFGLSALDLHTGFNFSSSVCQVAGYGNCNLDLLRAAEGQTLQTELLQAGVKVVGHPPSSFGFFPWSVDGGVLPELPREMLSKLGSIYSLNSKAVITGFVSMDGVISPPLTVGVPPLPKSPEEYQAYMNSYFGGNLTQISIVEKLYPISEFNGDVAQAWTQLNADACWVCPTLAVNEAILKSSPNTSLFTFEFFGAQAPYYSAHGGDVYFLFGMKQWAEYFWAGWDQNLVNEMQVAWGNFANSGSPQAIGSVEWIPFQNDSSVMMLQANAVRMQSSFAQQHHSNSCSFWLDERQITYPKLLELCWEYPRPQWPTSRNYN